jgi:phage pi2 protein 07
MGDVRTNIRMWDITMDTRIRLDIETVRKLLELYRAISRLDVKNVDFYENGMKVDISQSILDEWRFIGLSLPMFIETDFYKQGFIEVPI